MLSVNYIIERVHLHDCSLYWGDYIINNNNNNNNSLHI